MFLGKTVGEQRERSNRLLGWGLCLNVQRTVPEEEKGGLDVQRTVPEEKGVWPEPSKMSKCGLEIALTGIATATREREGEPSTLVESGRWLGSSLDLRSQVQRAPDLQSVEMVVPCFDDSQTRGRVLGFGFGFGFWFGFRFRFQEAMGGFRIRVPCFNDSRPEDGPGFGFGFGFPFRFSFQEPTGGSRIWPIAAPGSCSSLIWPRTVHELFIPILDPGSRTYIHMYICVQTYIYTHTYIYIYIHTLYMYIYGEFYPRARSCEAIWELGQHLLKCPCFPISSTSTSLTPPRR